MKCKPIYNIVEDAIWIPNTLVLPALGYEPLNSRKHLRFSEKKRMIKGFTLTQPKSLYSKNYKARGALIWVTSELEFLKLRQFFRNISKFR